MARESQLEQLFLREVRRRHGITIKIAPITAGVPDRLVLLPHRPAVLVELKAEGGALLPSQVVWHAKAAAIGHPVVVLTGREQMLAWLDETLPDDGLLG